MFTREHCHLNSPSLPLHSTWTFFWTMWITQREVVRAESGQNLDRFLPKIRANLKFCDCVIQATDMWLSVWKHFVKVLKLVCATQSSKQSEGDVQLLNVDQSWILIEYFLGGKGGVYCLNQFCLKVTLVLFEPIVYLKSGSPLCPPGPSSWRPF